MGGGLTDLEYIYIYLGGGQVKRGEVSISGWG